MGEGWSDALAFWSEQSSDKQVDFVLGAWVTNNPKGIRTYPYSTNMETNKHTYATVGTQNEGESRLFSS